MRARSAPGMRLRVLVPTHVAFDEDVDIVVAPGEDGSFGLLPHHVDFVNALVPGLLGVRQAGRERFIGVDGGLLVKRGDCVRVATPRATHGAALGEVRQIVRDNFLRRSQTELQARQALDQLEALVVRRVLELEGRRGR